MAGEALALVEVFPDFQLKHRLADHRFFRIAGQGGKTEVDIDDAAVFDKAADCHIRHIVGRRFRVSVRGCKCAPAGQQFAD